MKKFLSLALCFIMMFSVISVVPTVSAEEPSNIEKYYNQYWEHISRLESIEKIGDWYYRVLRESDDSIVNVMLIGYEGEDTDITIPTEIEGIEIKGLHNFAILSNTVETLRIPKEIISIDYHGSDMDYCPAFTSTSTNLKEIIVDGDNPRYKSIDGVLFSKDGKGLIYYPTAKRDREYVVPETVTAILDCAFIDNKLYLKSLTITQNVEYIGSLAFPNSKYGVENTGLEELYFKNCILTRRDIMELEGYYLPYVENGTVYCVEGSPLYERYKEIEEIYSKETKWNNQYFKELKTLPTAPDKLVKHADGKWYYYNDNYRSNATGIIMHQKVWFYVENGVWTKKTDLVKYKGVWFYVKNGKWSTANNTLIKKNGKWFAVKDGKWYKGKTLISYKGKKFYCNNGFAKLGYNGKVKINGKTYTIKGGKVA